MTTKYPMPEPLSHHEERIAHSMGAEIESRNPNSLLMSNPPQPTYFKLDTEPTWNHNHLYRVKPDCQYALAKIAELGGDEMADIYKAWLGGTEIEVYCGIVESYGEPKVDKDDPFKSFINICGMPIRLKKKKVKQVLWVNEWSGENDMRNICWLDSDKSLDNKLWHKVPTATREVEV